MTSFQVNDLFSVKDKICLITGGSRGIGFAMAKGLISNGATVIISSRSAKACESACAELNTMASNSDRSGGGGGGGLAIPIPCDISTDKGCKELIDKVSERFDKLHVLINNAGATWGAPLTKYPDSAWDKILALNVKSIFHMTKYAYPLLKRGVTGEGEFKSTTSIINVGSISGIVPPMLEIYAYSTSKAAVHHLTKHLADRLAKDGIRVNCIAPGFIPTKMTQATLGQYGEQMKKDTPLQRLGNEEDIAGITLFLSSSRASGWITGDVIAVDGGSVIKSHL